MPTPYRTLLPFVLAASIAAIPTGAFAAPQRTFVASTGSDAYPCSLAFPCRTLAAAVTSVAAGGEVVALDSAGYGAVAIDKSVTIAGPPGVQASITATSGLAAVYVGASSADRVVLRGLDIVTAGSVNSGIAVFGTGEVIIEDSDISGSAPFGVGLSGPGLFTISRCRITAAAGGTALSANGSPGKVRLVVDDTRLEASGSGHALLANQDVSATIRNSHLVGGTYGLRAEGAAAPKLVAISVQKSLISEHIYGIYSSGNAVLLSSGVSVVDSSVTHNEFGVWATSGGTIALTSSHVGHNLWGATAEGTGIVFTDGRNFFGYNQNDLNLTTTLLGPIGIR